ncbi:MAG: DUF1015 domain-containing protein [Flavobacteriales bacterium]|nr:DUF1015 domain-containing protein [Flavobacteriales bacterium]
MAIVRPFKAIRPTRDKVHLFASRSYLSYTDETLKEKLEHNPFTFLHIINPEYKKKNKKSGIEKFKLVKKKFDEFKQNKILKRDSRNAFYLYRQTRETHVFEGIIAACSVTDYLNGTIKVHEHTLTKREKLFKDYLDITGFNADPVLLSYKDNTTISEVINVISKTRAEFDFTTTNKVQHELWLIDTEQDIHTITDAFNKLDNIYIADGHHRCASSALLSKEKSSDNSNYFMSYLIGESQLKIINFNRLVKSLNGLTVAELLKKIASSFILKEVTAHTYTPTELNEISMYLAGKWYSLIVKDCIIKTDLVSQLDPAILSATILAPILNITDEKTDKNISFEAGTTPLAVLKEKVDNGEFTVAFILKPIPIDAIKEVADNNMIMPPKSTYIEPKLRSGITIYPID